MTQSLEQFLYSIISIVIGGGISIATQWLLTHHRQKLDNREKLRESRLQTYSAIWKWLCNYDKPSANLESIHSSWVLSSEKYRELKSLVMISSPFLSAAMSQALHELLSFWRSDLSEWRGSRQICEIKDRPYSKSDEYDNFVENILRISQLEINTLFNLKK